MDKLFPILAIETTDVLCSVAILLSEKEYYELSIQGKHIHSQKLVVMIETLLKSANLTFSDLRALAVSEGPGSFTGLRIGMSAAKGIAVGANLPMVLVPTFDALALKISSFLKTGEKFVILKKASKDDCYFGAYSVTENKFSIIETLQLVENNNISSFLTDELIIYSNLDNFSQNTKLTMPTALNIGEWAYKFGKDLLTSNYDFIEPRYLKEFLVRTKK